MSGAGPVQVVVVDSQQSFCDAMRVALDAEADLECVAAAPNAQELLDLLDDIDPNVALVDLAVDGDTPVALARRIHDRRPHCAVVLLGSPRPAVLRDAIAIGVANIVLKDQGLEVLLDVIREAADDPAATVDEEVVAEVLLGVEHTPALTEREQGVLELLGVGVPPKQIARRLDITTNTVRGHIKAILKKLDCHSTLEAVLVAQQAGLLPAHDDGAPRA